MVVTVLGKIAILILYGKQYLEATASLEILIWATGFAMIGTARGIWIVAEGFNKYTKYYVFIGAAVNFALNLLFIPTLGITGASVTTLISQITVAFISPLFFKKARQFDAIYFGAFSQYRELLEMTKNFLKSKR